MRLDGRQQSPQSTLAAPHLPARALAPQAADELVRALQPHAAVLHLRRQRCLARGRSLKRGLQRRDLLLHRCKARLRARGATRAGVRGARSRLSVARSRGAGSVTSLLVFAAQRLRRRARHRASCRHPVLTATPTPLPAPRTCASESSASVLSSAACAAASAARLGATDRATV